MKMNVITPSERLANYELQARQERKPYWVYLPDMTRLYVSWFDPIPDVGREQGFMYVLADREGIAMRTLNRETAVDLVGWKWTVKCGCRESGNASYTCPLHYKEINGQ
jgi:hypothetical protein